MRSLKKMYPEVGASRPASIFNVVDFPLPLDPSTTRNSPLFMSKLRLFTAVVCLYCFVMSCSRIFIPSPHLTLNPEQHISGKTVKRYGGEVLPRQRQQQYNPRGFH